jgi:hypothetical protein
MQTFALIARQNKQQEDTLLVVYILGKANAISLASIQTFVKNIRANSNIPLTSL